MITLLKMPALFLGMLAVFCCLGSFFIRENRYESGHLGETVLFGFIAYYFLFELISVPMMVQSCICSHGYGLLLWLSL